MPSLLQRLFAKRRPPGEPFRVWMTFDDGPDPVQTPRVLDVLGAQGIQAAFFVMGRRVEMCPAVVERTAAEGHRIGNHTYSHPTLTKLPQPAIEDELARTERLIGHLMQGPKLFRPPYGRRNATVDRAAAALGYRTLMWNVETDDWDPKNWPLRWVELGLRNLQYETDAIVINHDIHDATAQHLDLFIRRIKASGEARFMQASDL
jgi:peptidoglycan-N-acetylglucosamine deacetylase